MANWCHSLVTFYGDKKDVLRLHKSLAKIERRGVSIFNKRYSRSDFGKPWLGNILIKHGFSHKSFACRGYFSLEEGPFNADLFPNTTPSLWAIEISVETANTPMLAMWNAVITQSYPSLKYVFLLEEHSSKLYINSDTEHIFYDEEYYLEAYLPPELYVNLSGQPNTLGDAYYTEYYTTSQLTKLLQAFTGSISEDLQELIALSVNVVSSYSSASTGTYILDIHHYSNTYTVQ